MRAARFMIRKTTTAESSLCVFFGHFGPDPTDIVHISLIAVLIAPDSWSKLGASVVFVAVYS